MPPVPVRLGGALRRGELIRRTSRFGALVRLDGQALYVHVPNSGRLGELMVPGVPVLVDLPAAGLAPRKTAGTLLLTEYLGHWVSVDSRLPSRLFAASHRTLEPFAAYGCVRAEVPYGSSRFDFACAAGPWSGAALPPPGGDPPAALVEVKSCNRVEADGTALFPDAVTARGTRHLRELAAAAAAGYRAAVGVFILRADAPRRQPFDGTPPAVGAPQRAAVAAGVEAHAWRCTVEPPYIEVTAAVPVVL